MRNYAQLRRRLSGASAALAFGLLGACASTPPAGPEAPPVVVRPPAPSPPPAESRRNEIALVIDESAQSYALVAAEIDALLPPASYRVTRINAAELAAGAASEWRSRSVTVVAVGSRAVAAARHALPGAPTVFCQVQDTEGLFAANRRIWGVQPLPPLALQLKAWKDLDPTLRTIALIVSDPDSAVAAEARRAASTLATDLLVETSASDRETLYLFRRLAAGVDGLWLLPDRTALSPNTLRELLRYATARSIGVLAFNDGLLSRGALLSATSTPTDIAAAVHRVVERVVAGQTANLPAMTPLAAVALQVNPAVAASLGLRPAATTSWVIREPD